MLSNRIVGYSISDRMKARLAVDALAQADAARRAVDLMVESGLLDKVTAQVDTGELG